MPCRSFEHTDDLTRRLRYYYFVSSKFSDIDLFNSPYFHRNKARVGMFKTVGTYMFKTLFKTYFKHCYCFKQCFKHVFTVHCLEPVFFFERVLKILRPKPEKPGLWEAIYWGGKISKQIFLNINVFLIKFA